MTYFLKAFVTLSSLSSQVSVYSDKSLHHSNRLSLLNCSVRRYGGIQAIAMAYRGTANNAAIQKLLHYAVSDVSDDVRRAAVMCLGFVLIGSPEQCPKIVALLSESYNPHVRYGKAYSTFHDL